MQINRPRILLIAPTALDYHGRPIKERRLHLPALTLPYIAALFPVDVDIRIVYETVEDIPFDRHWDLVGITGMGSGIVRGWQIADEFRRRGVPVVFGGIAASLGKPELTLEHADALVIGDAEESVPRLFSDFQSGRLSRIYESEPADQSASMPVPRYELMNKAHMGWWRPVQATRGCPHTCSFCSVTSFRRGTYYCRPVADVIRDIRALKASNTKYIAFVDDNIGGNIDYATELFEALIPERIIWMAQCTILMAESPSLLRLARRSGCRLVSIGIESTSKDGLETINKSWNNPERYSRAINNFRHHGIEVSTEMIVGLDTDEEVVFQRTADFILSNRIAVPRVHILTPIPGTALYKKLEREGRIIEPDFANYTGSKPVFKTERIDSTTLQQEYWRLYEKLFSWRGIFKRLIPGRAHIGLYMRAVVWASNIRYRGHVKARISPGIL